MSHNTLTLSRYMHTGCLLLAAIFITAFTAQAQPSSKNYGTALPPIALWKGTDIHAKEVTLTPYIPQRGNGTAVLVCPGGSYYWLAKKVEGREVAQRLNEKGIAAFVLHYRVSGWEAFFWHTQLLTGKQLWPAPLADVRQALNHIRTHAAQYGIDSTRTGIMGFSAGGHLALATAVFARATPLSSPYDRLLSVSPPTFVAAIYPVVSMRDKATHKRSRRALLGENARKKEALLNELSIEQQTQHITVPVYLLACMDDPVVDFRNSMLLDSALTANGKPHVFRQFAHGGHGFGTRKHHWLDDFAQWLLTLFPQKSKNQYTHTHAL